MRPNVKFRVDLPKTNLGLAKSHLQRHVATCKKPPPTNIISLIFLYIFFKKKIILPLFIPNYYISQIPNGYIF